MITPAVVLCISAVGAISCAYLAWVEHRKYVETVRRVQKGLSLAAINAEADAIAKEWGAK